MVSKEVGVGPAVCRTRAIASLWLQLDGTGEGSGHAEGDGGCGLEEAWARHQPQNV